MCFSQLVRIVVYGAVIATTHSCKWKPATKAASKSVESDGYQTEKYSIVGIFEGTAKRTVSLGPGSADVVDVNLSDKSWFGFFNRYRNAVKNDRCKNVVQGDPNLLLPYVSMYARDIMPPQPKGLRGKLHLVGANETFIPTDAARIDLRAFFQGAIAVCESKDDASEKENLEKYESIRRSLEAMKTKLTISTRSLFTLHVVEKFPKLLLWDIIANAKLSLTKDVNYTYPHNIPIDTPSMLFLQKTTPSLRQHRQLEAIQDSVYSWDELGMYSGSGIPLFYNKFAEFAATYPLISGAIPLLGTSLAAADSLLTLVEGKDAKGNQVSDNRAQMDFALSIAFATIDGAMAYEAISTPLIRKIRDGAKKTSERLNDLRKRLEAGEQVTTREIAELKNTAQLEAEHLAGVRKAGDEIRQESRFESIAKNLKFKACAIGTIKTLGLSTAGLGLTNDDCIMSPVFPELEELYRELLGAETYGKIAANTQPVLDANYIVGNSDLLSTQRMKDFIKNGEYKSPNQYLFVEKKLPSADGGGGVGAWSSLDGRMLIEEFSGDEIDVIIAPGRTHADDVKDFILGGKYLRQKDVFTGCSSQCHTVELTKAHTLQAETKGLTETILMELYRASQHP